MAKQEEEKDNAFNFSNPDWCVYSKVGVNTIRIPFPNKPTPFDLTFTKYGVGTPLPGAVFSLDELGGDPTTAVHPKTGGISKQAKSGEDGRVHFHRCMLASIP